MSRAQRGESNLLADMGIASPPAAARNVTVENFLHPGQVNRLRRAAPVYNSTV
jgi:hypothetical protein